MKMKWTVIMIIALVLFSAGQAFCQPPFTTYATDKYEPFRGFAALFRSVAPGAIPAVGQIAGVGEAHIRIVSVTPIAGNNPLNTSQPVLNFGGVVVATVADLVNCVQLGGCPQTVAPVPDSCPSGTCIPFYCFDTLGGSMRAGIKFNTTAKTFQLTTVVAEGNVFFSTFTPPDLTFAYQPMTGWSGDKDVYMPGISAGTHTYSWTKTGPPARNISVTATLTRTAQCSGTLKVVNVQWNY